MNPGLVIKLRPAGPWRIGPDSGARNRVDAIYHSDTLYSAVTSAMSRLGLLEEWLEATARSAAPAVSFSSCFPFLDDVGFVVPPKTIWPPTSPALMSARVRWKSARFVPLGMVEALLAGRRIDVNHWSVDGASECLVPAGSPGPFRTALRWSAAVDRLTGSSERHSTACMEFRPGAGLWLVVGFASENAHQRWADRVKAAFRLLADSGFGGERSRGWGRSEAPEFIEGRLPEMILPAAAQAVAATPEVKETPPEPAVIAEAAVEAPSELAAQVAPVEPAAEGTEGGQADPSLDVGDSLRSRDQEGAVDTVPVSASSGEFPTTDEAAAKTGEDGQAKASPTGAADGPAPASLAPEVAASVKGHSHWLLSLYAPAAADTVDWTRGNYSVLARGGRIDSPAGAGELKKQLQMVAEGSVVYAATAPCGAAPDVSPDGFAHPVFRAGFALAIQLPEVS